MAFLDASEVYDILNRLGATDLYHANSVTTSCTFLREKGLMSRALVENLGLKQTPQPSDDKDRKYRIWDCIFLDHVDIHDRGGAKVGPNRYGPVLFRFDLDILLHMPPDSRIRVTKGNPINWHPEDRRSDRWFRSSADLSENIHFGDFGKTIVIKTPSGKLRFPRRSASIILDDPKRQVSSGESAYEKARNLLRSASQDGRVEARINRRVCPNDCICLETYEEFTQGEIDLYFS